METSFSIYLISNDCEIVKYNLVLCNQSNTLHLFDTKFCKREEKMSQMPHYFVKVEFQYIRVKSFLNNLHLYIKKNNTKKYMHFNLIFHKIELKYSSVKKIAGKLCNDFLTFCRTGSAYLKQKTSYYITLQLHMRCAII